MSDEPALSPRQKKFCEEYIIDFNAPHAAIRAGYKPRSAGVAGCRLLRYPAVDAYIVLLRAEQRKQTADTVKDVLHELAVIAFADAGELLNLAGEDAMLDTSNAMQSRAIASASVSKSKEGGAQQVQLKMHDKVGALKVLARCLGMFDRKPVNPDEQFVATIRRRPDMYDLLKYEKDAPEGLPQEDEDGTVKE